MEAAADEDAAGGRFVRDDQGEDLLGGEVGGGEAEEAANGFRGVAPAPDPAGEDETQLVAAGRAFEQPEPAAEPTAGGLRGGEVELARRQPAAPTSARKARVSSGRFGPQRRYAVVSKSDAYSQTASKSDSRKGRSTRRSVRTSPSSGAFRASADSAHRSDPQDFGGGAEAVGA